MSERIRMPRNIAYFATGVVIGLAVRAGFDRISQPTFEPIVYFDDDHSIKRMGEKTFEIADTRPGNTLHPDRRAHLNNAAVELQDEYGCEIIDKREDRQHHTLIIDINNPQCIFDARDSAK